MPLPGTSHSDNEICRRFTMPAEYLKNQSPEVFEFVQTHLSFSAYAMLCFQQAKCISRLRTRFQRGYRRNWINLKDEGDS